MSNEHGIDEHHHHGGIANERWYGVYRTVVADALDPQQLGRVLVTLPPSIADPPQQRWARPATLMAGPNRGTWFVPDAGDEVLIAFEGGDLDEPYVVGSLWNASARPPETMDATNSRTTIASRDGVRFSISDAPGADACTIETPGGQRVVVRDGPGTVTIEDANGNEILLDPSGIRIRASARVAIEASEVQVSAGMVTVSAAMTTFAGVVQAQTLIAESVVASSYTPGAGNVL